MNKSNKILEPAKILKTFSTANCKECKAVGYLQNSNGKTNP